MGRTDLENGQFVTYFTMDRHPGQGAIEVSPDGKYLVIRRRPLRPGEEPGAHIFTRDVPDELWAYPVDGGRPHKICDVPTTIRGQMRLSPDGRNLAFFGGERRAELWVIEPETR